jgi:hypothetical protein
MAFMARFLVQVPQLLLHLGMKVQHKAVFFTFLLSSLLVFADITNDIMSGLKTGNAKLIAGYFNATVELNLPGNDGLFSKAQSELLLKDFFVKFPPKNFIFKHDGTSQDGSRFSIGVLETSGGNFRTYYYLKKNGDAFLLKELRIEKER